MGGKGTARRLAVVHALRRSLGGWRRCEPAVPSLFIFEIATCDFFSRKLKDMGSAATKRRGGVQ